ncbi:MAG: PAS domain S-box protein, partial [Candidatus Thorarchaeota archaeon]
MKEENKNTTPSKDQISSTEDNNKLIDEILNLQEKLIFTEKQLEALFEFTNDAVIYMDLEGRYIKANTRAKELLGFTTEELSNITALDFVSLDEHNSSRERLTNLISGEKIPLYERKFRKKTGEIFIGEINLSVVKFGDESYIQSIIRDVTPRKKAIASITKERAVLQEIILLALTAKSMKEFCDHVLQFLVKYLDFEIGTLRVVNETLQVTVPISMYGIKDNLVKEIAIIPLTDTSRIFSHVIQTGKPIFAPKFDECEELARFKERQKLFNLASVISWPIIDENNKPIGALQLSSTKPKEIPEEDREFFTSLSRILAITIKKILSDEALLKAYDEKRELYEIINLTPAIVFLWKNQDGWPIEYVSDNVEIFGYSPKELIENNVQYKHLIHPDHMHLFELNDGISWREDYEYQFPIEYKIVTKDGKIRWVVEYSYPRANENSFVTNYFGIVLDITSRKKVEDIIKRERIIFKIIAEAAWGATNVSQLCNNLISDFCASLGFNFGTIRLYNKSTETLNRITLLNKSKTIEPSIDKLPINDPSMFAALVARTKEPIFAPIVNSKYLTEEKIQLLRNRNILSFITWPLFNSKKELMGIVQLASDVETNYVEEEKSFFNTLFDLIAHTIEKQQTQEELENSERRFRTTVETMSDG